MILLLNILSIWIMSHLITCMNSRELSYSLLLDKNYIAWYKDNEGIGQM